MKHSASEIITKKTVYDAGGGAGRKSIDFETLFEGQCSMYARTVNFCSDFQKEHLAQEARQVTIVDQPITIHINVAREDFPDITARIEVTYLKSASSQAWAQLLKDVCTSLKIDFIHSILDRVDKSPVHRIPRLRPGGDYLVRQRETSAILEVINTGRTPMEVSWGITMDINDVKQSLALDQRSMPVIDKRVASLVAKPVTRETQREITTLIMNAVSPKSAVTIIEQFHKLYVGTGATAGEQPSAGADETPPLGDIAKYGDAIDIISLHRLCLETLSRFVVDGRAKQIATGPCFEYVCNVIEQLRSEVDVVTIGLKLLTEVMKYLVEDRERVFHVILNCVQAYAPPESKHRTRNPKRLKPPEDQYAESSAQSPLAGYGALGQASAPMMGTKEVVMPETHPSLLRYGDFYGHSAPCDKDAAVAMSENIKSSAATLARLKTPEQVKRPTSSHSVANKQDVPVSQNSASDTLTSTQPVQPSGPSSEPIALIRGRARVDKSAASQALQSALTGQPTSLPTVAAEAAGPITQPAHGPPPSDAAGESEEFVRQQELFREQQKSKPQKYQFKIKVKTGGASDGATGEGVGGGDAGGGDDKQHKKWKGSIGAIGRRAPEKPKEVAIDFKKKVVYDPTADQDKDGGAGADPDAVNAAAQRVEEAESGAAIANALAAAASPTANKRKKKRKFELIPLALVPCVQFRGFSGRIRQSTAMTQSFATLYKMVSQNYGNRDVAFKMGVPEEVSVIATVCQAMPRVLDYYMWIIDALYRDGFGELNADELDIALEDYTMVLSVSQTSGVGNTGNTSKQGHGQGLGQDKADTKSLAGMQFETISEMSVPSIDQDGLYSEATPVVNMGVVTDSTPLPGADGNNNRRPSRRVSSTGAAAAQEGSQVGTDDARDENVPVPSNQIKKAANQLLINVMGLFEFESRYVHRPTENIVLAVAMISAHAELEAREKLLAAKWLDIWDDGSRSYKLLKKKGMDLAGL